MRRGGPVPVQWEAERSLQWKRVARASPRRPARTEEATQPYAATISDRYSLLKKSFRARALIETKPLRRRLRS